MDLWSQIKKTSQEAAGKAKDLAGVTKLQLAQKDAEHKLEKLFTQLGKDLYAKEAENADSDFAEQFKAITDAYTEIESLKEQQALLKNGVRCASCGALMTADSMFCPSCGAAKNAQPAEVVEEEIDDGKIACPGCGKRVDRKAFCSFCGTKLN